MDETDHSACLTNQTDNDLFTGKRNDVNRAVHEPTNQSLWPAFQYDHVISAVVWGDILCHKTKYVGLNSTISV